MELATRDELLTAYTAGTTSPGLSLLCAAHLTLSPESRAYVSGLEELGGALLRDEPLDDAATDTAPSLEAMLALIDQEEADRASDPRAGSSRLVDGAAGAAPDFGPLPAPIGRAVGKNFSDMAWKFRLPGISEHTLDSFDREKVSLLRARPGSRVLGHTHVGFEATLVLTGAMKDGDRVLTRGDVALCGPEHDHHPEIIGDETCYCLIVVDGALRFTGAFTRALNLFAE